eukprot:1148812-Pelagomonas_calceolata.AAC.21
MALKCHAGHDGMFTPWKECEGHFGHLNAKATIGTRCTSHLPTWTSVLLGRECFSGSIEGVEHPAGYFVRLPGVSLGLTCEPQW